MAVFLLESYLAIVHPFPRDPDKSELAIKKSSNKYDFFSKKYKKSWETAVLQKNK